MEQHKPFNLKPWFIAAGVLLILGSVLLVVGNARYEGCDTLAGQFTAAFNQAARDHCDTARGMKVWGGLVVWVGVIVLVLATIYRFSLGRHRESQSDARAAIPSPPGGSPRAQSDAAALLDSLKKQFAQGKITEQTYLELKAEYENRLKTESTH